MASLTHMDPESSGSALYRSPKPTTIDLVGGIYCHICHITYANKKEYDLHYIKHETGSKEIVYTCVVCHKEIAGYPSFRGHCYTSHVIKDRFKCEHCSKLFSKSLSLKEHIKVMHRFKCSSCNKEFTTKKELQLHQIIHNNTDMPPFKCQACDNQIDSLEGCKEHIELHSASIYFCPVCNENISSRDNAKEHLKKHFGDDNEDQPITHKNFDKQESYIEQLGGISCKYCPLIYKDRVEFDAHFSCEHGNEDIVYTCNVCGKHFEKYSVFSDHSYNHFMKDRFCCDICHKTFNRLSLLVTHMSACQANMDANGKPFGCFQCGHRYVTEMRLREHLRDAHAIHCIMCPEEGCQKIFSTPKDLITHQREHRSQQNWCRQCGLLFPTLKSCERHLDVHKKKLYICPVCNRNYSEKYLILKHVPQHFETVLHLCKVCGKVYNAKNRLIEHIKTHSESKNHKCTYCGKGFVKIGQLQQHLNVHTGSKPYKCPICSKTFASYPNWHKHLRRMHKVDGKKYKKCTENVPNIIDESESDSTETLDEEESPAEIDINEINMNQSILGVAPELDGNLTNARLHVDISETYTFQEPEDSTMEPDDIDRIIIEKELEIFEDTANLKNIVEFINVLPADIGGCGPTPAAGPVAPPGPAAPAAPVVPAEYGPEFAEPDEHMLHIDPLLTIKHAGPGWEPLLTRVFPDVLESSRFSMMNTDIF